jgi:uncharacterized membrane protein YwzB
MNAKLLMYVVTFPLTLMTLLSLNLNKFFKKNKVLEAKIFYILLTMCITHLVVNFLYDFIEVSKFH